MIPVKTTPYLCPKDWGGERLRTLFGKPVPEPRTGESWEISAHENGQCEAWGMPLSKAVATYGRELMGDVKPPFPLLIKLLDARENLSVQVHPDDALAMELEGQPYGKTEAWVVLDAPPGAELILGVDCSPEQFRAAVEAGDIDIHLKRLKVAPGDTIFIPAGTIHALTAGIVVYEVQQSSDTTYRLYAWGRDAQLHIEPSIRAMALPAKGAGLVVPTPISPGIERLVACDAFTLDRITPKHSLFVLSDPSRFACYTALGPGEMYYQGESIAYAAGESMLVPAHAGDIKLNGGVLLRATPGI